MPLQDGQLHARREDFEELAEEGQGCHGRVTKVRHRETHTIMAMKAIDLATPSSEQSGRIVRELNILRSASPCSAIINYYGAFYDNHTGVIHIAMEYMDAGSLDKLLKRESAVTMRSHRSFGHPAVAEAADPPSLACLLPGSPAANFPALPGPLWKSRSSSARWCPRGVCRENCLRQHQGALVPEEGAQCHPPR